MEYKILEKQDLELMLDFVDDGIIYVYDLKK